MDQFDATLSELGFELRNAVFQFEIDVAMQLQQQSGNILVYLLIVRIDCNSPQTLDAF